MTRFAADTKVSTENSRAEIERTLRRYGCSHFGYSMAPDGAQIGFRMKELSILFRLPLPDMKDFARDGRKHQRSPEKQMAAWEQACRQRWRALALAIKAKLESVETGITTFEQEFLAHVVTGSGRTIGELMVPELVRISQGASIPLLEGPKP